MEMVTLVVAAGRDTAWARWEDYLPSVPNYEEQSQRVAPGHAAVSRLSPALRHRLILERELIESLLGTYSPGEAGPFIQQLCRRVYEKAWLEQRPSLWAKWREECPRLRASLTPDQSVRLQDLERGACGCAPINYFARELVELGYMHEKARRWFASWWVHVEGLPWELGADFFYRHLLDADAACNLFGWREVVGTRREGRCQPTLQGDFERCCAPEIIGDGRGLERLIEESRAPSLDEPVPEIQPAAIPIPPRFSGRIGLWLHPDDLLLERSALASLKPAAIAGFLPVDVLGKFGYSVARRAYESMALEDGLERARAHYSCAGEGGEAPSLPAAMTAWAAKHRLARVVALAPFVGEWNEIMEPLRIALQSAGVQFQAHRRPSDLRFWEKARDGFQPFWEDFQMALANGAWKK